MSSDLLMPSDVPARPEEPRSPRWFAVPAVVALGLVGAFVLIARWSGNDMDIESELVLAITQGMTPERRADLSNRIVKVIERGDRWRTDPAFPLLALGRVWENEPRTGDAAALAARRRALQTLLAQTTSADTSRRKAAVLALAFWRDATDANSVRRALLERLGDAREDLDVRIAAAAALGSMAGLADQPVISALEQAHRSSEGRDAELSWNAGLSLARLGHPSATPTLLALLDRAVLEKLTIYDRHADPIKPPQRNLNEAEIERFLINAIGAAARCVDPAVQARLHELARSDPSPRVRAAAKR